MKTVVRTGCVDGMGRGGGAVDAKTLMPKSRGPAEGACRFGWPVFAVKGRSQSIESPFAALWSERDAMKVCRLCTMPNLKSGIFASPHS